MSQETMTCHHVERRDTGGYAQTKSGFKRNSVERIRTQPGDKVMTSLGGGDSNLHKQKKNEVHGRRSKQNKNMHVMHFWFIEYKSPVGT